MLTAFPFAPLGKPLATTSITEQKTEALRDHSKLKLNRMRRGHYQSRGAAAREFLVDAFSFSFPLTGHNDFLYTALRGFSVPEVHHTRSVP